MRKDLSWIKLSVTDHQISRRPSPEALHLISPPVSCDQPSMTIEMLRFSEGGGATGLSRPPVCFPADLLSARLPYEASVWLKRLKCGPEL